MNDDWDELIRGGRWLSSDTLWVEDDTESSWQQVDELAASIEQAIREHGPVRVVHVRSEAKLGCFAGQLAAWRVGCIPVADDGKLGPGELDRVRPELTVAVGPDDKPTVETAAPQAERLPLDRLSPDIVAVNFTSGSTGSRKAVGVTRANLLALFGCRDLDVPVTGRLSSASFATPTYDGWWFDTWRAVSAGGIVVCLPSVNEDVFAWPELTEAYRIDTALLPAAVIATILEAVPDCIAGIGWVYSGGEQFRVSTYQRARQAGLTNRFVNLYGPTEATFATHGYELPDGFDGAAIPIGRPLDGCEQSLRALETDGSGGHELVVAGPFVCAGYLEGGFVGHRFRADDGRPTYRTGDLVRLDDDGQLVYVGRVDSQLKVNGMRVDAAALEHEVIGLPGVHDCRVVQDERLTVAFVRADASSDLAARIESVVKRFSPAIAVGLVDRFPMKSGGKVDTALLMAHHCRTDKGGEK